MDSTTRRARHSGALPRLAAFTALGIAAGLVLAAQEVGRHAYLGYRFWRTSLWIACDHTLRGAAVGAAAGLLVLLLALGYRQLLSALQRRGPAVSGSSATDAASSPIVLRVTVFLAFTSAAATLFLPAGSRTRLHLPQDLVVVASLVALWLFVIALACFVRRSREDDPSTWFKLQSAAIIGLLYVVIFLRAWHAAPRREALLTATVGILAAAAAYLTLLAAERRIGHLFRRAWRLVTAWRVWRALLWAGLTASIALWTAGWGTRVHARSQAGQHRTNVIIIGVDTLRADRVSLLSEHEHDRDLTPNLRKLLAPRGTVFSQAITQAPWTVPAVASIFTGLYPEEHGAQYLGHALSPPRLTLAEIAREAGYQTLAVTSSGNVGPRVGLHQGFAKLDQSQVKGVTAITSQQVTDRAIGLLRAHRGEPFFLFAYYLDPHYNYLDHSEFHFADDYQGWLRPESRIPGQISLLRMKEYRFGPSEHQFVRDLYDEEIAYTDAHIGRLLAYLTEAGLWDSTLVVFFADHGEEFYERGWIGHTVSLYDELVRVPLVIAAPAHQQTPVFSHPVELRWLFRTVLDFLGLSKPKGTDSSPSLIAEPSDERTFVRSSTHPVRVPGAPGTSLGKNVWLTCLVGERWKLINDHFAGSTMLFDRRDDPGETRDLGPDLTDLRRDLQRVLDERNAAVRDRSPTGPSPRLDEEEMRRLKSLGYI